MAAWLRERRLQLAAATAVILVALVGGIVTATLLAPRETAGPGASSSPRASALASTNQSAASSAAASLVPASPGTTSTQTPSVPPPPPHSVDAGVIQALTNVRVRSTPGLDGAVVAMLGAGQQARTRGSLVEADSYTWTDIELRPSGVRGWAAIADSTHTDPWLASVRDGPLVVTTADREVLIDPAIGLGGWVELVDSQTGGRTVLTTGAEVTDLAIAPDGARAAVAATGHRVEIIGLDTVTELDWTASQGTKTFVVVRDPSFSFDGLAVAFRAGTWGFLEAQLEWYGPGASPRLASVGSVGEPAWSPDGEIWTDVHDADDENYDVVALGLDGSVRRVTEGIGFDGSPAPAPDGSRIAYFSDDETGALSVVLARPNGRGQRVLYTPKSFSGYFAPLRWEPAGSRVAMRLDFTDDSGNEARSRVVLVDTITGEHTEFAGPGVDCGELTWSPTGGRLAMVCRAEQGGPRHLFIMGTDGSDVVDLGPAIEMDWARDLAR